MIKAVPYECSGGGIFCCCLGSFAPNATGQLNVLGHDGDALGVNGAQIGIFKESDQVGFGSFLQSQHGRSLEAQIALKVLRDFTDQALEGQFTNEQVGTFLVATNLAQGDRARAVPMRLFDAASGRGGLAGRLGGELLARGLATCALPSAVDGIGNDYVLLLVSTKEDDGQLIRLIDRNVRLLGAGHGRCWKQEKKERKTAFKRLGVRILCDDRKR
jgi:hypothetical protein